MPEIKCQIDGNGKIHLQLDDYKVELSTRDATYLKFDDRHEENYVHLLI